MAKGANILHKVERACAQMLADASLSFSPTIYTGLDNEAVTLPAVVCAALSAAQAWEVPTGTFRVDVEIQVKEQADDTDEDTHEVNSQEVFNQFVHSDCVADLTAAVDDFMANYAWGFSQRFETIERHYITTLSFMLECGGNPN